MKLSTRARYALRMLLDISKDVRDPSPTSLKTVSKRTGISKRYLEQLALVLKNAGLIRGIPGKNGGYFLTRPPGEISIREIFESAIGTINIVDCVEQPESCENADCCECRSVYSFINHQITSVLDSLSLADLASNDALFHFAQFPVADRTQL